MTSTLAWMSVLWLPAQLATKRQQHGTPVPAGCRCPGTQCAMEAMTACNVGDALHLYATMRTVVHPEAAETEVCSRA